MTSEDARDGIRIAADDAGDLARPSVVDISGLG
jgi:hypothetical protein